MEYKPENRVCQNCHKDFTIEPDDFLFYEKIKVPAPTFCPECRRQRRFAWRNFINFYHRKSFFTSDNVLSLYSEESGIPVVSPKEWHSVNWNPFVYGQEFNFHDNFFSQYIKLIRKVPRPSMDTDDGLMSKNCEYTNDFSMGKNCYLVVKAWKLENVMYSFYVVNSHDLVDVNTSFGKDEGNYETINTKQCYQCRFIFDSQSCIDCRYSYNLRNCSSCFMCSNLRGKKHCYNNKQYTKDEYQKILDSYKLNTYSGSQKAYSEFIDLYTISPKKALRMTNCVNSLGDLLTNCKNCNYCFCLLDSENARYCNFADGVRDSLDADASGGSELCYESDFTAFCYNVLGSYFIFNCRDSFYLQHCFRCSNCFGCVGLKDSSYCILNKQYTKEEYENLLPKIIKLMNDDPYVDKVGRKYYFADFLPIELSYFSYNDTFANDIYALNEQQIKKENYFFKKHKSFDDFKDAISSENLPDDINDVDDGILSKIFFSKTTGRNYRITNNELNFYRKHQIPLPRESFYERYERRFRFTTSFKFFKSFSTKSKESIITNYDPKDNFTVYSLEEYKKEFE